MRLAPAALATLAALALLAAAPGAQAALVNKAQPFSKGFPFMAGLGEAGAMTVVSGKLEADLGEAVGSFGFFESGGFSVSGLDKVCYAQGNGPACPQSPARTLSLTVEPGGSFAVCFPGSSQARVQARHALALFSDLAQDDDLNTFPVDESLVAPAVGGTVAFGSIPAIPSTFSNLQGQCVDSAGLTGLDDGTRVTVRDGGATVATLLGKNARAAFSGRPVVPAVQAGFVIVPFGPGSEARFTPAAADDARAGLDLQRVKDLLDLLDQAHASTRVDRPTEPGSGNNTQEFLASLLNGAVLRFPEGVGNSSQVPLDGMHFIRFSGMSVALQAGGLAWTGKAFLEVEDGHVKGARNLVGFAVFQLPWWSYVLWAIALTVAIVRLVLKPDKNHPRWDPLRWVGWVATPVAWVIVFVLWDFEVHTVLGASLLRGASGQFLLIVALLQLGLLAFVAFAAAAPLRVLLRNSFLLAHQGTFMGLAGSVAALVGFFLGAPYLRAYLGLILEKVMERLA